MMKFFPNVKNLFVFCLVLVFFSPVLAGDIIHTIEVSKSSIVGIGSFLKTRSPAVTFVGTGFVVGDGLDVITNAHVVMPILHSETQEALGIIIGKGNSVEFRPAVVVAIDEEHDLIRLKLNGAPLPALELGDSSKIMEGRPIAFTGFPLGMVLGLHHVTHRGMVSAITPLVMPAMDSRKLDVKMIAQLRKSSFDVLQLDATAYPGNSGSPVYDPETGVVYGVISKVFVNGLKEAAITAPSGISYAIPANYARELLLRKQP